MMSRSTLVTIPFQPDPLSAMYTEHGRGIFEVGAIDPQRIPPTRPGPASRLIRPPI